MLFHASLDINEYHEILNQNKIDVIINNISDPECGGATVWFVKKIFHNEATRFN